MPKAFSLSRLAVILLTILVSFDVSAQDDKSAQLYNQSSRLIYEASSQIFDCLAKAKEKPNNEQALLALSALAKLEEALKKYQDLRGWQKADLVAKDEQSKEVLDYLRRELNVKDLRVEHVIEFSTKAIRDLKEIIGKWDKCNAAFRSNSDYMKFIAAKVRVERATQLSEIAFVPKP